LRGFVFLQPRRHAEIALQGQAGLWYSRANIIGNHPAYVYIKVFKDRYL